MNKIVILFLAFLLVGCNLILKDNSKSDYKAYFDKEFDGGSKINIPEVTDEVVKDLDLLARVWGFLKYHHPEIAKGNYNWDYELFRFLPKYLNREEGDKYRLLIKWINSLGYVPTSIHNDSEAYIKPDMNWINTGIDSDKLKRKLLNIYNNRNKGKHFYIEMAKYVGNPVFINENTYASMPYPDQGFRLLALFRYWNMINYFFPYKYLIDKDWDNILQEYIPKFLNAECELEYEMVVLQIIADIKDTHANIFSGNNKIDEWKGNNYAPVHIKFIGDKPVVVDYYNPELKKETGLKIGDVITKIDGKKIEEVIQEYYTYYPASNHSARLRDIAEDLLRSPEQELEISYIRSGKEITRSLMIYPKENLNKYRWYRKTDEKCFKLLGNNIGYITLENIKEDDIPKIKQEFRDTRGIIIDIRNYPSAFVPFKLGTYFVSKTTPFVKFTVGSVDTPGKFSLTKELKLFKSEETYKGKLIVLVNEYTQSQAEYTSMAFRAGSNTTIVGSTTAGADGNVSAINLPGGLKTRISGIGVYYPDGKKTQRVGIVPDVEVKPTIEGIIKGKDELLEKAVELILKEGN